MQGAWPTPCPVPPGALAALWDAGGRGARVAAAYGAGPGRAGAIARGRDFTPVGPADGPGAWGPAQVAASALGAAWLVVPTPWPGDARRWHAAELALRAMGMGLWRPFALLDPLAVARLGLATGADVAGAPDLDDRLRAALGLPS